MKTDRILSLLSMAAGSGNVRSGEFQTEDAVKKGKAKLVIAAEDASDNKKKQLSNTCEYYKVPFRIYSDMESLGHAIGKEFRACLCISESGFSKKALSLLDAREG